MRGVILAVAILISTAANGEVVRGNDLARFCREDVGRCDGYISGVWDVFALTSRICPYGPVEYQRVKDLVTVYLESHADRRDQPAAVVVLEATLPAFPCKL
jgi:hypothetical protein